MNPTKIKNLSPVALYLFKYNLIYLLELKARRQLYGFLATVGLITVSALVLALTGEW